MVDESTKQNALMELQTADQQLKQMQEYMDNFDQQMLTIQEILTSLEEFEKMKPGSKMLVPLQNGIFMEAILGESKNLKMNVGSGTVVDKTVSEAREMMTKQLESVTTYKAEISLQMDELSARVQELQGAVGK